MKFFKPSFKKTKKELLFGFDNLKWGQSSNELLKFIISEHKARFGRNDFDEHGNKIMSLLDGNFWDIEIRSWHLTFGISVNIKDEEFYSGLIIFKRFNTSPFDEYQLLNKVIEKKYGPPDAEKQSPDMHFWYYKKNNEDKAGISCSILPSKYVGIGFHSYELMQKYVTNS